MPPVTFNVSEVRVAATCPRITYFDAEHTRRNRLKSRSMTRIWKAGGSDTACGTLFHEAIELFNQRALSAVEVRDAFLVDPEPRPLERRLRAYLNTRCINLDALAQRTAAQQQAFIRAVGVYMGELADIAGDALARGKPADEILEQLFGDPRRRVDVTFQVGPMGEPVRVTGILDYVFYDWRTARHRILDYKLTPAGEPANDLFQVALYALMHHVQHRTEPDVGVLYLHPERLMVELAWEQVHSQRYKMFDLLASMARWVHYDERLKTGLKPPGEPTNCEFCRWNRRNECVRRLGPKHEGERLTHWSQDVPRDEPRMEPTIDRDIIDGPPRAWARPVAPSEADFLEPATVPPGSIETVDDQRLQVGSLVGSMESVGLPLSILPTHVAIVGAAGSGKTWMAKVVAEEAIRLGVPVLAVDPQGDLVQFLRPGPDRPTFTPGERARREEFLSRVEPRIWTPGSSHGRRLCLDPIRLASRDDLARILDPRRREEEWEGMLAGCANQLVSLAKVGREADSQQAFVLQVLRILAERQGDGAIALDAIAAATADPFSIGFDDADGLIRKADREKLARKLNSLRLGPAASLFTGGEPLDLDAMCRPGSVGEVPLNVVYLNALIDDNQKHFFVAALASEVYRWMITSGEPNQLRPRLLFYLDEARDFIPAGASQPPAKPPLIRLFTQGRKFGVACLLCTQSPRSVDHNVFSNCSTKLVGRLESAQDVDRVAEWFKTGGSSPDWLDYRKGAQAGSFVGRWPGIAGNVEGQPFRGRPLFSLHEGAWSPDRVEREWNSLRAEAER